MTSLDHALSVNRSRDALTKEITPSFVTKKHVERDGAVSGGDRPPP